jgi:hypothetical protein
MCLVILLPCQLFLVEAFLKSPAETQNEIHRILQIKIYYIGISENIHQQNEEKTILIKLITMCTSYYTVVEVPTSENAKIQMAPRYIYLNDKSITITVLPSEFWCSL